MAKYEHAIRDVGLIYFVLAEGLELIKIGYTTAGFKARLAVIQTGSPVPIKPLVVWKSRTMTDERNLHNRFRRWRQHGEWYDYAIEIRGYLEDLRRYRRNEITLFIPDDQVF